MHNFSRETGFHIVELTLIFALCLGVLGGTGASFVILVWLRRANPDQADLDDLAAEVASQGKALRRLTMKAVRQYAAEPAAAAAEANAPTPKEALRARVFGRAKTVQ